MNSDSQLVQSAQQGDPTAFGDLVRRNQQALLRAMLPVTENHEEAQDIVQEAFIQAYRNLDSFRGDSAFFTWIYRIAFNLAKARHRKQRPLSIDTSSLSMPTAEPSAEQQFESSEFRIILRTAIAELSINHQQVIILRELEELDYDEIAQRLDLSVGTVRSRLHRARGQLRELLQQWL
ncbi:MAG: sigma-70 family RNA polymerase sigma factor [Planctomycetaceae bacterium]|nr:sigma-70 family RNA polymerase sigma factor [Planctomycetaceae bacterium]MBT4010849.1 sigma-70 family RNA polymerase sigma factor [Planctomycetaceae bacterium]MBT4723429.1 sigma-70 family RNA polymerase sigma factor [Planctomycetaceae bacterium]MBT4844821.1 sigma-70 family RNA polymerase sigma factor [Planctomycetaceae bacterium]MBT5126305.1 sigma-70 family RNA polymerase sigma factor [Planctomycetaceae bacterium]